MSRRHLAVTVTAVGLLCSSAVAAAHADSPALGRLSGTFDVTGKVTQSTNGEPVGTTWVRPFKFVPQCASGACPTMSIRTRGDGVVVKNLLSPTLNSYKGTKTYLGACFLHNGTQVANAYTYTETTTITPIKAGPNVTTFTGSLKFVAKPTAIGVAKNCGYSTETLTLNHK